MIAPKWLRAWLGTEDLRTASAASTRAVRDYAVSLEKLIEAQGKEIQALKYQRLQREAKAQQAFVPSDWETIQAAYAATPENYKES
jgi:hypothetical protein